MGKGAGKVESLYSMIQLIQSSSKEGVPYMYDAQDLISSQETLSQRRNFRMMIVNGGLSTMGVSGFSLAIVWFALNITNSPVLAGFADGMGALPLFFSFAFGAYVDSLATKRRLAIVTSAFRLLSIFALFLAVEFHSLFVATASIYFVAFMMGLTSDIMNSVRASWTKQFLKEDAYKSGVSTFQSVLSLAQGAGFALSGGLILLGTSTAVYGFALVFAVSLFPLFFIRNDGTDLISKEKNIQSSLMNGAKYIFRDTRLRALIIIVLFVNLAFGAVGIFFAVLVDDRFGLPAIYYTTLFLCLTLGIFLGSAIGGKARGKVGFYSVMMVFISGALLFSMGTIENVYVDYPVSFAIGVAIGIVNVVVNTALIKIVEQSMMARVSGAVRTFGVSLTFLSGAIGGVMIRLFTLSGAFYLIGSIVVASACLPMIFRDFYNLTV